MKRPRDELNELLSRLRTGDSTLLGRITEVAFEDLFDVALSLCSRFSRGILRPEPDDLLNEFFLEFAKGSHTEFKNSEAFFAYAWETMLFILKKMSRDPLPPITGGKRLLYDIKDDSRIAVFQPDIVYFHDLLGSLKRLRNVDQRKSELAYLRACRGLTFEEAAKVLGISPRTAKREWAFVRNWLQTDFFGLPKPITPDSMKDDRTQQNLAGSIYTVRLVDSALLKILSKKPELLKTLDWRVFEELLARILETFEYEIELTRSTKDGGVDIFAIKRGTEFGPHRYLLQAKRWTNVIGVEPVRELLFLHSHHRVTKSCLATTSTFTRGAWELARDYRWQLELRDYNKLHEWVMEAVRVRGS